MVHTPSSASAWRKLHDALGNETETQRSQEDALNTVLVVGFGELGINQRSRFLKLAVLANGVLAPTDMLCHLWDEEVRCKIFCRAFESITPFADTCESSKSRRSRASA